MNTKLLLLIAIIAGFSSCSTAYKAGQTPDDVYYSPVRPQNDYVRVHNDEDKNVYNNTDEDRNIRTSVRNRRWRRYDDYDYNYPYGVPYGNQYPPVYINPKTGVTSPATKPQPRKYNLGAYKKPADDNTTPPSDPGNLKGGNQVPPPTNNTAPVRTFPKQSTNKNGTGVGNFIRDLFSGAGQSTNNSSDNSSSTRTFGGTNNNSNNNSNNNNSSNNSNAGSNSSSSGKSNSSSAPVRTFDKNN